MNKFIAAPFGNYIKTKNTISVSGSWTVEKRTGRIVQIVKTLRYTKRGWVNKIGLRNPGLTIGLPKHKTGEVFSIAGIEKDDWRLFAERIPNDFNIEVNMSCPNIDAHYIDGIEDFEPDTRNWYIGKISPLTTFQELDEYINKFRFKQIHACNTLPIDKGGLSGKELIPYTSKFVKHIKDSYPDIEVIAGGGIDSLKDIEYYKNIGADHISLGMYVDGVHAADLSLMLDTHGVAVRAGHHCVQPFHRKLGIDATIRSTAYIYNDKEDIDTLKSALISSVEMLR